MNVPERSNRRPGEGLKKSICLPAKLQFINRQMREVTV